MPKIAYQEQRFTEATLRTIAIANEILEEYAAQGFDVTLRQLYYQFVARGYLRENTLRAYKSLGDIINNGRLAGLIDWYYLTDRTRNLKGRSRWENPEEVIESAARSYHRDQWKDQKERVEVWIEKDALTGVIQRPCYELDTPYFSCRGYTSQSEMWSAARRIIGYEKEGQKVTIIHLGDHDPSGQDMTRDIADRLKLFGAKARVERIALNMDQVRQYNPPPNPAKITDTRAGEYIRKHGTESWELDALEPATLAALVRERVNDHIEPAKWQRIYEGTEEQRAQIATVAQHWQQIAQYAKRKFGKEA